jgi:FtsH-binding integral membrane protein
MTDLYIFPLIYLPTVFTIVGARRFQKQPLQLMRLFYGVESPLFLLCLIRLFMLRELNPASSLIIATIVVCIAAFLVEMLYGYLGKQENFQDFST